MADVRTVDFDSTIAALQQNLAALPVDDVCRVIDGWQQKLQGSDIAEGLGQLKQAIRDGDTSVIATILTALGEDTRKAAANTTDANTATKAKRVGELLSQAANSLK